MTQDMQQSAANIKLTQRGICAISVLIVIVLLNKYSVNNALCIVHGSNNHLFLKRYTIVTYFF